MDDYEWDTIDINTLNKMRNFMTTKGWLKEDVTHIINEIYSYFSLKDNWDNPEKNNLGNLKPKLGINCYTWNPDLIWRYFEKTGRGMGINSDKITFIEALLKSIGIPATSLNYDCITIENEKNELSIFLYYNPITKKWYIPRKSLDDINDPIKWGKMYLLVPSILQQHYFSYSPVSSTSTPEVDAYYREETLKDIIRNRFILGVNTKSRFKRYIYRNKHPGDLKNSFSVIVEHSLKRYLNEEINTYLEDIKKQGYTPIVRYVNEEDPSELKEYVKSIPNIKGVVFIGHIRHMNFEMSVKWNSYSASNEKFPCDFYFGSFKTHLLDVNADGYYDSYVGQPSQDIFVGRIYAKTLPKDRIKLLKDYFHRNHEFRNGNKKFPNRALLYIDEAGLPVDTISDYWKHREEFKNALLLAFNSVVMVADPATTNAENYLKTLSETSGYELIRVFGHGSGAGRIFYKNGVPTKVTSDDIWRINPKTYFIMDTGCHLANFTIPNYMDGAYVFSKNGLLATGHSWINDEIAWHQEIFFGSLSKNKIFGIALRDYLNYCTENWVRVDSMFDTILIGDPLLWIY